MNKTQHARAQHTLHTLRRDIGALLAAGLGATPLDLVGLKTRVDDLDEVLFSTVVHRRIGQGPDAQALCKQANAATLTDNPDLVTCAKCRAAQTV